MRRNAAAAREGGRGGTELQLVLRKFVLVDSAVHAKRVSDREQAHHTHTRGNG